MSYNQWIRINELYKQMESFFRISNSFSNYWPKTEKYSNQLDIESLIKVQYIVYQYIQFNKLYKLMEKFSKILESFFELVTICVELHAFQFNLFRKYSKEYLPFLL